MPSWDETIDVVVVGAGGCGLVAAIAAAERGASVAVLEKLERLAGNTAISTASIPGAGTRFQRAAGLDDSPQKFAADLRRISGPHEADELTDLLASVSAPLVEWLVDSAKVELDIITAYRHVGHSVPRLHAPRSHRGSDLINDLSRAAAARDIPVAFASPVTELVTDETGRVCGVVTRGEGGGTARIAAKAVILATNGFGNNRILLNRHCPDVAGIGYSGALGSEGEAIVWGERLGARLANMAAYQAHSGIAQPHGALVTWTVMEKGGIVVDATGARFADETIGYSAFAAWSARARAPVYALYDARIRDFTIAQQEEFGELNQHGGCIVCDTPAALAARFSFDAATIAHTLADAQAAARGGAVDSFSRSGWGFGALEPPFVVTPIAPALFHTQGGLAVDRDARVLRQDGTAIAGLYAGGGAAAGISGYAGGAGYCSGNGLLAALGLGLIAGRAAAAQAGAGSGTENAKAK
jgi:fumarate reductase flavoprotein subunit